MFLNFSSPFSALQFRKVCLFKSELAKTILIGRGFFCSAEGFPTRSFNTAAVLGGSRGLGEILKSIRALSDDNYVKIMREAFSRDDRDLATLKRVADHNQKRLKVWKRESVKKSSNGGNESPPTEDLNEFVEVSP